MMEEYRRLFARYQATMERAGELIPKSFGRFVQELEEQRQRLAARGLQVEGFDVVREPSGVRVRPRTRAGGH
jgi:arginyl-tRNA--protein-N-Asp/Glu arginylyltransferase